MNIDIYGVNAQECETDYGEYWISFYPKDHSRSEVRKEIPDNYTICHREHDEGGELVTWFIEQE